MSSGLFSAFVVAAQSIQPHSRAQVKRWRCRQTNESALLRRRSTPDRRPRRAPVRLRVDLVPDELDVVEERFRHFRVVRERDFVPVSSGKAEKITCESPELRLMQPRKSRRRGVCGADEQPEQERPDTHVCSLANKLLAGLPSLTFFIMTGFDLIHSRITSCTNVRGAFVLIEPATACEREIS